MTVDSFSGGAADADAGSGDGLDWLASTASTSVDVLLAVAVVRTAFLLVARLDLFLLAGLLETALVDSGLLESLITYRQICPRHCEQ